MELYGYLILIVIVVGFLALLPLVSGVGTFNMNKGANVQGKKKEGMVDFKLAAEKEGRTGTASSSSRAGKFSVDSKTGLKRRVIGKYSADPSTYDFDIDDLIKEDAVQEREEQEKRYADMAGKTEEVLDELV